MLNHHRWDSLKPAWIVTRREIRDQFRDWRVIFPIVALTMFFPTLMNFTARQAVNYVQQYGANLIAERFIPFLLMIVGFFPISISLVIALESFAGETERHSIEPLLSSPLTDWQLYLGKLLASLVPPVLGSYLGITVYLIGVYRSVGWQTEPVFLLQVILLTTVQALVMVSGAVVVSTQTTSVRAANLLASFIIIPAALLIQGESIIMLWGSYDVLWWIIIALALVSGMLVRAGLAHFNREDLLGREIDVLNFRKNWQVFKEAFIGEAHSFREWVVHEVGQTLKKIIIPLVISTFLLAVGIWIGMDISKQLNLPPEFLSLERIFDLDQSIVSGLKNAGFMSWRNAISIWFHNLQVILLATVLGIFSFGILGILILMMPLALIGFFAEAASALGFSKWAFLAAFTLPHGILEFPAIILAGAAILRVGATMVTPAQNQSISEAWLRALADWLKIIVIFVIPLFLAAAFIEVFITPQTLANFLSK